MKPTDKIVSIPSEFTLLSNSAQMLDSERKVSIPSEFTLLSNKVKEEKKAVESFNTL